MRVYASAHTSERSRLVDMLGRAYLPRAVEEDNARSTRVRTRDASFAIVDFASRVLLLTRDYQRFDMINDLLKLWLKLISLVSET